jgi:hypothetical protein
MPSVVVLKIVVLHVVFRLKVLPGAIPTPLVPLTVRVPEPDIVEVPLLAVVIDANDLDTSILSVPPAFIVTVLPAVIVLAFTVLPDVIVVCPLTPKHPKLNTTTNNKNLICIEIANAFASRKFFFIQWYI